VAEMAVGEATLIDAGEVHPHVPRLLLHDLHCRPIWLGGQRDHPRPGFGSGGSNAACSRPTVSVERSGRTMSKWGWSPVARRAKPAAWTRATVDRRTWP